MAVQTCLIRSGQGAGIGWSLPPATKSILRYCVAALTRQPGHKQLARQPQEVPRRRYLALRISPPIAIGAATVKFTKSVRESRPGGHSRGEELAQEGPSCRPAVNG
jgi:hypothetical protein